MSLIHIYLDKECDSRQKFLKLLKNSNVNFLEFNLNNDEITKSNYKIDKLPAIKFENEIVYEIDEDSVKKIIEKFNSFIENLPKPNNSFSCKILVNTIKVSDKSKLSKYFENFSKKHKKSTLTI